MNYSKARTKVERLRRQAIECRQPHKYMQASHILKEIDRRTNGNELFRNEFINKLRA